MKFSQNCKCSIEKCDLNLPLHGTVQWQCLVALSSIRSSVWWMWTLGLVLSFPFSLFLLLESSSQCLYCTIQCFKWMEILLQGGNYILLLQPLVIIIYCYYIGHLFDFFRRCCPNEIGFSILERSQGIIFHCSWNPACGNTSFILAHSFRGEKGGDLLYWGNIMALEQ